MSLYLLMKLVHVIAAIVAVGTNLTYFVWLRRAEDPTEAAPFLRGIRTLDARVANPAYVVLPITGVVMVLDADLGFATLWIAVAIGLYVAVAVLGGAVFAPAIRRQTEAAERGESGTAAYARLAGRTKLAGIITMLPVAGILYLMVVKPDL